MLDDVDREACPEIEHNRESYYHFVISFQILVNDKTFEEEPFLVLMERPMKVSFHLIFHTESHLFL